MTMLVAYASAQGSTAGVAERIAGRLGTHGVAAEVSPAGAVADVARYAGVVLGSAIHGGSWLPEAADCVERVLALEEPPALWLFSVATVGDQSSALAGPMSGLLRAMMRRTGWPKNIATRLEHPAVRGHRAFAGVIGGEQYGRTGRLVFRAMGGRYGDHRPWAEIDAWADQIAREVTRRDYAV